jgi:hypothetical protein
MDNKEMKKRSRGILSLWLLIAAVTAGGTFLVYSHINDSGSASIAPQVDSSPDAVPSQQFSGDGYAFNVPSTWYVDQTTNDAVAVYPDYSPAPGSAPDADSSSTATCKLEMSIFPSVPPADTVGWISQRIGADPSLAVVEQSSEDISIAGGTGVQWNGTIDGVPTTLVYAFSADHAYEIAPSVVNQTMGDGNAQCAPALGTFLSQLTLE